MLWDTIKVYVQALIAFLIAGLATYGFIQKKRADANAEEIDELEREIETQGYNHEVKQFEAVNLTKKEKVDEEINSVNMGDNKLDPNATY